jgi:hypothetical protein
MRFRALTILIYATLGLSLFSGQLLARQPEEAEFMAAEKIGEDVADWISGLERRPTSIGIFNVYSNYPLDGDFSTVVETEIMKSLAKSDFQNVQSCSECRANNVSIVNDRVVVSKGAPDMESLKRIGKNQPVETFLMVEVYRTKLSVIAHAVLYYNPSGILISAQRFRVTAVSFSDASTQLLLTAGFGMSLGINPTPTELGTGVNLSLLEEMGFAKGGLVLGGAFGGSSSILYLCPTLAFRGRFGHGGIAWLLGLGIGYGMGGSSKGLTTHASYDLTLGSLAVIGLEFTYFMPSPTVANALTGFAGVHFGVALGR